MKTKTDVLKALKDTGRRLYINEEMALSAPQNSGEIELFTIGKYITDDELEKEYESRGLVPASIISLCEYEKTNQEDLDKKQSVGTHWKDDKGNWCYAAFGLWRGERGVDILRSVGVWGVDWWFGAVRPKAFNFPKSALPESEKLVSGTMQRKNNGLRKSLDLKTSEKLLDSLPLELEINGVKYKKL
jgi:hypothetical protein